MVQCGTPPSSWREIAAQEVREGFGQGEGGRHDEAGDLHVLAGSGGPVTSNSPIRFSMAAAGREPKSSFGPDSLGALVFLPQAANQTFRSFGNNLSAIGDLLQVYRFACRHPESAGCFASGGVGIKQCGAINGHHEGMFRVQISSGKGFASAICCFPKLMTYNLCKPLEQGRRCCCPGIQETACFMLFGTSAGCLHV